MKKDIAIVFPSGRKCVKNVVGMLARDMDEYGHFDNYRSHLIISYDPTFYGLQAEDFEIDRRVAAKFASVTYSGPADYTNFQRFKRLPGVTEEMFDILFKPRGYCSQKNRAIVRALQKRVDHITFFDDDEYFVAPFKSKDGLEWIAQDVLGTHLKYNAGADITNGAHTGYFSPVPSDLEYSLEQKVRLRLGEILSIGNEVIHGKTFMNTRESAKYGDVSFTTSSPSEIPERAGVRSLNGGNITLNAESIRQGRLPPYFNPHGARGEDAILGMQISALSVKRVPTYTFHDPFQKYVRITEGEFPDALEAITVCEGTVNRFSKACIGWIRYAPFLIRLTSQDDNEYRLRIERMMGPLEELGPQIDHQLGVNGFSEMASTLGEFDARSQQDVQDLNDSKDAWRHIVQTDWRSDTV